MPQLFTNNATAPLAASIVAVDTTLSVATGQGAKFPALSGDTFTITVTSADGTVQEIMVVTARSTDDLTVTRAQEGTSAEPFTAGAVVELRLTAAGLNSFVQEGEADAVTYAMLQNVSATDKVLGRSTSGSGNVEEIACTAAGRALIDDATASDQRTTLGVYSTSDTDTAIAAAVNGLSWKQAVRAATTAPGTLASSFENGDTIDGVTLATGNRILIKDQSSGSENGIYVVAAIGAPTRATDADSGAELVNASVYVSEGTANADTQWTCTTNATITVNSTPLAFAQLATGGPPTGSAGGSLTGTYPNPTIANDAPTNTQSYGNSSSRIATTAFVQAALATVVDDGNSSTADTIDFSAGNVHKSTLTGTCTYTFTAPPNGTVVVLKVIQGSGPYTVTWPAAVHWPASTAPTLTTTNGHFDVFTFLYLDSIYTSVTSGQDYTP